MAFLRRPKRPLLLLLLLIAIGTSSGGRGAMAEPLLAPDLRACSPATDRGPAGDQNAVLFNCCLPLVPPHKIVEFSHSAYQSPYNITRIRHPAHKVSADYVAKLEQAYAKMRALPETDPRSLKVQADLHCAYCNGAYNQTTSHKASTSASSAARTPLQVHFSWLFFPWHRLYLYFHERILAHLIDDPTFALVYWNWDDQVNGGNLFPSIYSSNASSLYDSYRNPNNTLTSRLVRLITKSSATSNAVVIDENLNSMYQSMVTARTADLFSGGPYRFGTNLSNSTVVNAPLGGSVENSVHNGIHFWTGSGPLHPLGMDMGTFTTASRDPIFYAHHSNIDRLWDIWRFHLPGGERQDHDDPDFLDTEFAFYDEYANLVKVKVRDSLDLTKLGYKYKRVTSDKVWIRYQPRPVTKGSALAAAREAGLPEIGAAPLNGTISLENRLVAIVKRPKALNLKMPEHGAEVLELQGVTVTRDSFMQLLVFVNLPNATNATATNMAEYVGAFNIIPTASRHKRLVTNVRLEVGDNIKRVGIAEDDEVVVTVVVKGEQKVTIQGIRIIYAGR